MTGNSLQNPDIVFGDLSQYASSTHPGPNSPAAAAFELPGLKTTDFNLLDTDITVIPGPPEMEHPRLALSGNAGAFEGTYKWGELIVDEVPQDQDYDNRPTERRKALLQVPSHYKASAHTLTTGKGDVFVAGTSADALRVRSGFGTVALRHLGAGQVNVETGAAVEATGVVSPGTITVQSGGTIDIGGHAGFWDLRARNDIDARSALGLVDAYSQFGKVRT